MECNLTSGNILKNVLYFSLPYLLSYLLQTLYGMADLFIVGQFGGVAETTAVSIGSQVMHMFTVVIVGLAMGTTVLIGQATGGGNREKVSVGIGNTITLFLTLSALLTLILVLFANPLARLMSTPKDALAGTVSYLTVCFLGIPFITAYNVISSIFRGMGDSKSPMYFVAVACVANILLDYVFMGIFRLGPTGAALGTTLSQAISVLISLWYIRKKTTGISVSFSDLRPRRAIMGQLLKIGIPVACQDGLIQVAFLLITVIANHRGLNDSAAVGIVEKIISFLFLVPSSMLSTVSALGAQNFGAGKPERAEKTLRYAMMLSAGFGLCVAIIMQFIAEPVVGLFTDTSAPDGMEVVRLGGQYLHGYAWDCLFAGIHFCFSGYFCAAGRSELSFLHNIIAIALMRVPGVYLTSKLFPQTLLPMGIATAFGSVISVIICLIAYTALKRQRRLRASECSD